MPPLFDYSTASLAQQVAPAPYVDRFARVLGSDLGPERATEVLAMADQGYLWSLADLLSEVRSRDGHLHGDLTRREMRVAGAEWELRPPEGSGQMGAAVAQWCTARLREMEAAGDLSRDFALMVSDLMGAVYHGRAAHEMVWRTEPGVNRGGAWMVPAEAWWIHPRRFAYQTDWRLHVWDSAGTQPDVTSPVRTTSPFGQWPGVPLREANRVAPGKFVVVTPRTMGDYPTREGVGRLVMWFAVFKRMEIREWTALLAWAGRGLRHGVYKAERNPGDDTPLATTTHKRELERAIMVMGGANPAVYPDTCDIKVETPPTTGEMHSIFHRMCDEEMSKAIHSSTLGSAVSRSGGSRSQGEVHERNELAIAKGDATQIAAALYAQLLRPMVEMNFGRRDLTPRIVFAVDPAADLTALAERMTAWVGMGGKIGARTGANALQLPETEEDEEMIGGASPAPPTGAAGPATGPSAAPKAEGAPTPAASPESARAGAPEGSAAGGRAAPETDTAAPTPIT